MKNFITSIFLLSTSKAKELNQTDFAKALRDAIFAGLGIVFTDIIPFLNDRNISGIDLKQESILFISVFILSIGFRYFKNNPTQPRY